MATRSTITIKNCTFEKNAANFGGAIFVEFNSSITISNSTFRQNHAESCISGQCAGGAILISERSAVIISNTTFLNNTSDFDGGIAIIINATLQISHSFICTNTAGRHGGAVAAFRNSSLTFGGSLLNDSKAEHNGGALYLHESDSSISGCDFLFNNAKGDGGAIYEECNSTIKVNDSIFKSNNAPKGNGGALYGQNNSIVAISNSEFLNNQADDDTGGAMMVENDSKMNISECNLDGNVADYGGAIDVSTRSSASIKSCNFSGNRAKVNGAALHVYISSAANISSCTFSWNIANDSGAAVSAKKCCNISILDSSVYNCMASFSGGGVYLGHDSHSHVENCAFLNNTADFGGAILAYVIITVTIINSSFDQNEAAIQGGALHAYRNISISIRSSNFSSNKARSGGISFALQDCELSFQNSIIFGNNADFGGVIRLLERSVINITGGNFTHNTAQSGGVLYVHSSKVVVEMSANFTFNSARSFGGVIHANDDSTITISTAIFSNNTADKGGVLSLLGGSSVLIQYSYFTNNQAFNSGGVIYLNNASIMVYSSRFNSSSAFMRGGIFSASLASRVYIAGSNFSHGTAKLGAVLAVIEKSTLSFVQDDFTPSQLSLKDSKMHIRGANEILIENSAALWSGGGIYLSESSLCIGIETNISFNEAGSFGGGIHAIDSSIIVKHTVHFVSNKATSGGGLGLSNSKLYDVEDEGVLTSMNFMLNKADYGGAIYVKFSDDDENIADVCSGEYSSTSGCFFYNVSDAFMINFDKNYAKYKGDNLFGGLLDRCTVASSTHQSQMEPSGVVRFKSVSNITSLDTISSKPVQVCFCENHEPSCSMRSQALEVKHRDTILLELAAIDQVNHKLIAIIQSHIDGFELSANQATQTIGAACSNISYHITAPPRENLYKAIIYADGPCSDKGISKLTVDIKVVQCKCAMGFVIDNNDKACICECDQQLLNYNYIQGCDPDTDSVKREGVHWIAVTNKNNHNFSYLFFPYCPMGYCQPPSRLVYVNLSQHNGSDAQCANNHSGVLCGKCQPHYSLSLGSSKCTQCPKQWQRQLIGITIAALFSGIFLVAIILVLNLTVAIGTLNSIIFYANIIYSNRILRQSQFVSVFISWLNLDIGFDVCFYEGMDAYTKTWLQLTFPAYIIFLVVAIIWISSRSSTFSNLIGKRNPVATLATLILISYTKFLQTIIIIFSFVKSNGSATRWLYDASIVYFGWKHALLFFTGVLILLVGLFYTILLFSWQWLLHCPRSKIFNWTRNQKLHSFIDTYHTPHTARHRYWTGLLLLARVILYLIAAFSTSVYADPHIPLIATIVVMCCLLLFKTAMMIKVYRNWLLNAMDSFICFNIIIPAIFTLHSFTDKSLQPKVINISVGITMILLCFIIAFHAYRYGSVKLYTYCQNTKVCERMTRWLVSCIHSQQEKSSSGMPSDGRLLDILDSLRQDETEEIYDQHEQPTSSVVSLVHSEESPSSDYCLKLTEEQNQSEYQLDIDKMLWQERVKSRSMSASTQQGSSTTKNIELSYFSQDENIMKPILDKNL